MLSIYHLNPGQQRSILFDSINGWDGGVGVIIVSYGKESMMRFTMIIVVTLVLAGSFQMQGCGVSTDVQAAEAMIQTPSVQCGGCQDTITKALTAVAGVTGVQVNLDDKITTVTYNPGETNEYALVQAIVESGYQANDQQPNADVYADLPDCCKIP